LEQGQRSEAYQNWLEEQLQLLDFGKLKSPTPALRRELAAREAEGSWPLPLVEYEQKLREQEQALRDQNRYMHVPASRYARGPSPRRS
jgi:hypothetical protein